MAKASKRRCFADAIPRRYTLLALVIVGMIFNYSIRLVLSMAMVAMANSEEEQNIMDDNGTGNALECPGSPDYSNGTVNITKEFSWSSKTQGILLGGFFYGYASTQLIGGRLADVIGPKIMIGFGVGISSILTILSPLAARWNVWAFFAIRVLIGLSQGGVVPGINTLFSRWSGPNERTRMMGLSFVGMEIGSIVVMPLTGYLCKYGFAGGWPSAFYVVGTASFLWCVLWFFFAYDSPELHPGISVDERELIQRASVSSKGCGGVKKVTSMPLKSMLTSLPVWAVVVGLSSSSWGFYYIQTELPSYLNNVMKYSIVDNGYISSLTFSICAISTALWAFLADFIISRGYLTTTNTRKLLEVSGLIGSSIVLVVVTFLGCNSLAVIVSLNISSALLELTNSGDGTISIEVAPNSAGTIYGMANTGGSIAGILAPLVTGLFIGTNSHGLTEWSHTFYTAAAVQATGALFFLIFASAERQKWDHDDASDNEKLHENQEH